MALPLTPRAERTLVVAERIARDRGHDYIGTEHLMLALLADPDGIGGGAVHRAGHAEAAISEIIRILESESYAGGGGRRRHPESRGTQSDDS